ncbi:ependymin-like [Centroberyx gerrardi]|uniref:ependymin-like n=1 Tax=Centroberyx gerrardi TaxID=166262 RepID=UPI003AAFB86E
MNFLSLLACLSLALVAAAAQKPKPCVTPPLMSGGFSLMAGDGLVMFTGKMHYDAFGQRVRVRNYGMIGNETFILDQLMLFNQKVYYDIDWRKLSCKKRKLDVTFAPMQVSPEAQLMSQAVMGSLSSWGMGATVNTWAGVLPPNGMYMNVFTDVGCIPLTCMAFSPESGWTTISTFNWVLGTTDPMEFIPPYFCGKSKLEETEKAETFFTALVSLAKRTKREQ